MSEIIQPTLGKFATALAKAQGEFPVIPKDSEVEVKNKEGKFLYKYKYADLTTIISCTRPALSKHGLSFTQGVVQGGFATTFFHESGETYQSGFIPCDVPKNADMKQVAGLITYVKRISLTAALGVSADEDVDAGPNEATLGNSTEKKPVNKKPEPKVASPAPKPEININAPADKKLRDRLVNLMIDRNVHETSVNSLIVKGYGYPVDKYPIWVALEIGKLLEIEDTDDAAIEKKYQEVIARREAKSKG